MKQNTIGRDMPVKAAFTAHFGRGTDEIVAVTGEMKNWLARPRQTRLLVCEERMVDDVQKLIDKYHQSGKDSGNGIHSPFPVILIAFAKDHQPVAADRGFATPDAKLTRLAADGEWYRLRTDFVEKRVQIAFFAHTGETARAMTSQMRLYFQRFAEYRFPVTWHFGGYDFDLTVSLQEIPVADEMADVPERTNLTVLLWNLTLQYQIPYLQAPEPHQITADGHIKGYEMLKRVDFDLTDPQHIKFSDGLVDAAAPEPEHGSWTESP